MVMGQQLQQAARQLFVSSTQIRVAATVVHSADNRCPAAAAHAVGSLPIWTGHQQEERRYSVEPLRPNNYILMPREGMA
jgi:hypothetical protein